MLAVSSWAQNDKPALTIHFTDGTSVTTTYNAYDWFVNGDATKQAADAFAAGLNRYSPTQSPGWDQRGLTSAAIGEVDYSIWRTGRTLFSISGSRFVW